MDLSKLVGGLSKSGALSGFMGGVAGGGLTSMIASKKGRKVGKGALKVGALAAVGGIAWKAYQSYSANKGATAVSGVPHGAQSAPASQSQYFPSSQGHQAETYNAGGHVQSKAAQFDFRPAALPQQAFEEVVDQNNEQGQMLLMRAMISAAHADGHIDAQERQRIFAQVDTMELSVQEKATLFDELRKPLSLHDLVNQVPNAQTGIEVYAASASAVDTSAPASQAFLQELSQNLCIPSELVNSIHQQLAQY
ncbi:tellurite resistance TerB family protein [Glaciecola siphonariae]|uniref:Tellurite resistance TerB family protein n=1 Tax=Glaciecola siphonariae TaxID=521012 RepID=A0ABV9M1I3_9ALTE